MEPPFEPAPANDGGASGRAPGRAASGQAGSDQAGSGCKAPGRTESGCVAAGQAASARVEFGKLRWRCRRGMRELDELLTRYVDEQYAAASASDQAAFRVLLDSHDPLIHAYFLGRETPPDPVLSSLIDRITAGAGND